MSLITQSTICSKCGARYTCHGRTSKEYVRATSFKMRGGKWRPICADTEACAKMYLEKAPKVWVWRKGRKSEAS